MTRSALNPSTVAQPIARLFSGWRPWHYALILVLHVELFDATHVGLHDWFIFYPWADALRITLMKYHQFPWWNPWSITGQPLFADPTIAVLMPETLFELAFGTVVGLKVAIVFYVLVGYEGTRFLCRDLFGRSRFVEGLAVIPILLPALALHFNEGHIVFFDFYLFPWLLAFALTWWRSCGRALAFGVVIGLYLLSHIHYVVIMALNIAAVFALVALVRRARSLDTWARAALVGCSALGIGLTRIALSLSIVKGFPRQLIHYPLAYSFSQAITALIEPLQDRATSSLQVGDVSALETSSYVGLAALLLAYDGLRRSRRAYLFIYVAALVCMILAWNNRDWFFPSYWLHFAFPWKPMLVITRWSLFGAYFILLGTVWGLLSLRRTGRLGLATMLALVITADLGFHVWYAYRGTFLGGEAPPFIAAEDPPQTVGEHWENAWANIRKNRVTASAQCSLLGAAPTRPARITRDNPAYRGEFYGSQPVIVESWTPNRIVLRGTPGDTVTLNVNPSNYWTMNGARLFPAARAFEVHDPFRVTVPTSGRMELLPRPPGLGVLLGLQALFAIGAAILLRWCLRRRAYPPP